MHQALSSLQFVGIVKLGIKNAAPPSMGTLQFKQIDPQKG